MTIPVNVTATISVPLRGRSTPHVNGGAMLLSINDGTAGYSVGSGTLALHRTVTDPGLARFRHSHRHANSQPPTEMMPASTGADFPYCAPVMTKTRPRF